ncbi:unnamed protein product [Nippostrongylus brasiliensis]|uniref:CCDC50_N domain-containing protein n=1 Tax=Nippostrongylus brasiliensis TaxID=27835 RepID=A0A0N4XC96_NIPBR|nr:unnamed protein product [Nippostrongylus brasiliensis]
MPAKRKPQTSRYNSTIRRLGQQYPNHATKKSLCIAMEDMEVYLNDAQQQDHQREEQTNYENQLLHDQINRLRTQQRLQEDALEVENSRDHWQLRAQERSDENATLRRQVNQLERTQCDLEQQVQQLQRQLEQRRAQSLPRRDLPRNQPADGQDQRQQQPPIVRGAPQNHDERLREIRRTIRSMRRQIRQLEDLVNVFRNEFFVSITRTFIRRCSACSAER